MRVELLPVTPAEYVAHPLHTEERVWTETNCYADLWIEVLHAFALDPVAGLAFTLSTDFEGDQWTMFKFPTEDLRALFGLRVNELNVWRPLVDHVAEQLALGHLLTIDVDAWFLPDTAGITYRAEHQKTTLAAQMLDREARTLGYFHNAGYFELSDDDFDGVLGLGAYERPDVLPPYVEAVRFGGPRPTGDDEIAEAVAVVTRGHLERAPATNPVARLKRQLESDFGWLATSDLPTFHRYAFGTCRQCGAGAELAESFVGWLGARDGGGLEEAAESFHTISTSAKALEFGLARVIRGRRFDPGELLDTMQAAWDTAMSVLSKRYGA